MHKQLKMIICQWILLGSALLVPFIPAYASDWVGEGWQYIQNNEPEQALFSWQKGVNQLEDHTPLIVLRVLNDATTAIDLAQKVDRTESVFVIEATSQGQSIYYVLSARQVSLDLDDRHQQLASMRQAIDVKTKLFSDTASVFKGGRTKAEVTNDSGSVDFSKIDSDYALGRFEEALWALEDLQKVYPHNSEVNYRMGLIQEDMLEFDTAKVSYEKAIAKKELSDPTKAYSHLGGLLYKMQQYPEAKIAFEKGLRIQAKDAYTLYMLGLVLRKMGNFAESILAFQHAVKVSTSYKQNALYGQALNYIRMNNTQQAKKLLQESISVDPNTEVAAQAKTSLTKVLANERYFSVFGMYGYQYDSNVVLKPTPSPTVPVISGASDFAHTLLSVFTYAPPPSFDGTGYKASTMVYANLHDRLNSFDMVVLNATLTPYTSLSKNNVLSMDASFDYVLFNYKRYMDTIKLKPSLTYNYDKQWQLKVSLTASRDNYYQPVVLQTSMQDGWTVAEDMKVTRFSKDYQSSIYIGGAFTTSIARGTDWSFNSITGSVGVDIAVPWVQKLSTGIHGSLIRQKYKNITVGYRQPRRDTMYNADVSLSYPLTYVNVSLTASYTHERSNTPVYRYVKMMSGFNISGSF